MVEETKLCCGISLSESIRSFIAFDMQESSVQTKLASAQKLLVQTGADLKVVELQNIHITLRFLGGISPAMVEKVYGTMQKVQFKPFDIQICGLGVFPSLNYPRVVWAGITQGAEELKGIFSQIEPQIRALGFEADKNGFSPHLTIARVRSAKNKPQLAEYVTKKASDDFGKIHLDCLKLKQSKLSPKGPTYLTLKEVRAQKT
jgi:RNA 2',3'-cyclic 3'-phosphodiesterase